MHQQGARFFFILLTVEFSFIIRKKEEKGGVFILKEITKIVLTGGPCAGKTTALNRLRKHFIEQGYYVICIPETATELICSGISSWTLPGCYEYQLCHLKLQLKKEKIYGEAAEQIVGCDKILVVCDRGAIDSKVYLTEDDFSKALTALGTTEDEIIKRYDAVFHLVTTAKGARTFYTLSNNQARTESVEEAIVADNKSIEAWASHPYFRVIGNETGFEEKINKLINEISLFLNSRHKS